MKTPVSSTIVNVPNTLSVLRLVLSCALFVLIAYAQYLPAMICFIVAAGTDWIDGYWARKFQQVTKVGRMLDPFVDKMLICGTFIFLAAEQNSGIGAWVAVVIMGREMLVTALRSFIEQAGGDFSASWSGKWKMLFQCVAAGASLLTLAWLKNASETPVWLQWTLLLSVWVAVLSTVQSGIEYLFSAAKMMKQMG